MAISLVTAALAVSACLSDDDIPLPVPVNERPVLTTAQCAEMGGVVVGDPGDGRVHQRDYLCESGQPPLGTLMFLEGEPIPIEGAVCCPQLQ